LLDGVELCLAGEKAEAGDDAEDSGAMKEFALGCLCGAVLAAVALMLWVL